MSRITYPRAGKSDAKAQGPILEPRFRIWLESKFSEDAFGDGKMRLLEEVSRQGSLQAAARSLEVSYRKAWGDLQKIEACFAKPLIARTRGGPAGGKTELTPEGLALIEAYRAFREKVEAAVTRAFADFQKKLP